MWQECVAWSENGIKLDEDAHTHTGETGDLPKGAHSLGYTVTHRHIHTYVSRRHTRHGVSFNFALFLITVCAYNALATRNNNKNNHKIMYLHK